MALAYLINETYFHRNGRLVVVFGIVVNEAYAAPFEQDIIVKPSNPHTDERVTIICFNEPAHPAGVNGILEVEDQAGNSYAIGSTFKVGDLLSDRCNNMLDVFPLSFFMTDHIYPNLLSLSSMISCSDSDKPAS